MLVTQAAGACGGATSGKQAALDAATSSVEMDAAAPPLDAAATVVIDGAADVVVVPDLRQDIVEVFPPPRDASPPDVRPVLTPPAAAPPPPAGNCQDVTGAVVTRQAEHLAAGWETTLRFSFRDGVPADGRDLRGCVKAEDGQGNALPFAVEARTLKVAYTLLLVDPGATVEENRVAREAARAVITRRPVGERVGIWRWGAEAAQLATFTDDRAVLHARLAATLSPSDKRGGLDVALSRVAPVVEQVGGIGTDAVRAVVVIAPRNVEITPAAAAAGASTLVLWLAPAVADGPAGPVPVGLRFNLAPATPGDGATALSERIEDYKARAHVALGTCGSGAALEGNLRLTGVAAPVPLLLPAALYENLAGQCSYAAVAAGTRNFTRRIDFILTPEQRAVRDLASLAGERTDWSLDVRVSREHLPTSAVAHFRGSGSFRCARRNFTVTLDDKRPRYLMPGSAIRKFHFISMCLDRFYLRNFTATQLLAAEGLFPVKYELVELVIDGQTQGVYYMTENVDAAIVQQNSDVTGVVRRTTLGAGMTAPEVKFALTTDAAAIATYRSLLTDTARLSGKAFEDAVRARFNLDQYLQWIAVMHVLGSGDYVDEVYFYATSTLDPAGKPASFQGVSAWDNDDLFTLCHFDNQGSLPDPNGILYCVESELDKRLFAEPAIYDRFIEILHTTLDRISKIKVQAALGATTDRLLGYFKDPAILLAMTELARIDPVYLRNFNAVKAGLLADAAALAAQVEAQRADLGERIRRYRSMPLPLDAAFPAPRPDAGPDALSPGQ